MFNSCLVFLWIILFAASHHIHDQNVTEMFIQSCFNECSLRQFRCFLIIWWIYLIKRNAPKSLLHKQPNLENVQIQIEIKQKMGIPIINKNHIKWIYFRLECREPFLLLDHWYHINCTILIAMLAELVILSAFEINDYTKKR